MGGSQWWLRNLCCSLLSHQQHSYPGWINPLTAFFAQGRLMWFQQLQTQKASKLLEVEKAETPPSWESRVAVGQLGSALQNQRCTHTESFCPAALQHSWSVFPRSRGCCRGQQGGGRVQWALGVQWDRSSACWRALLERMVAMCVPWSCWNEFLCGAAVPALCAVPMSPSARRWRRWRWQLRLREQGHVVTVVSMRLFPQVVAWGCMVPVGFVVVWESVPNVTNPSGLVAWWLWMGCAYSEAAAKKWTDDWSGKGQRKGSLVTMSTFPGQKVISLHSTGHLWVEHLPLQQEVQGSPAWGANRWLDSSASIHHLFPRPRLPAAHPYSLKPRHSLWWLCKWKSSF